MGISTVSGIVQDVTKAIWDTMVADYMPVPTTEDWGAIAQEFEAKWGFPHCVGALDGKHVTVCAPDNTGSEFFNYKGAFSVVLLAVVDASYKFRVIDVGARGRSSDGGTLNNSAFGRALFTGALQLPAPKPLPDAEDQTPRPYVFVADEAFPLKENIMRPYPGRLTEEQHTYNYRLSRARMTVECAFGILSSQWRVYRRRMELQPETVDQVIKATCVLHNFMRTSTTDAAVTLPEDQPLNDVLTMGTSRNYTNKAFAIREAFKAYFAQQK